MQTRPTKPSTLPKAKVASGPKPSREPIRRWACMALILTAVFLAYSNSLPAPFVLDDHSSIVTNASIRDFWSFNWLTPPSMAGETVSGRPVLNLSFALNHAVGGLEVHGYHVFNVLVHAFSGLVLFALVHLTFVRWQAGLNRTGASLGPRAIEGIALSIAAVWALHPLNTGSVTYVVQRAESLAGLFYLLTLYGFAQYARPDSSSRRKWAVISVSACLLGMATKETVATAPLVVLLYDRAFISGSFRAAWRARGGLHASLAATWLLLIVLVVTNSGRGGSAGLHSAVDGWTYLLTQSHAIVRYLALTFWPRGQVFDYGVPVVGSLSEAIPQILLLIFLAGGAAWMLWRNWVSGFLAAAFFLLLAPSSSVVPIATQTMAEHRMYLALIIPITLVCLAFVRWWAPRALGVLLALALVVALGLGATTFARNHVYRTELSLWQDTVTKRPDNPRARNNLGLALEAGGQVDEAIAQYREAIALQPNHAFANSSLGTLLLSRGKATEAIVHLRAAVSAAPERADFHYHLALASEKIGDAAEAERAFREAIRLEPDWAVAHVALGNFLARTAADDAAELILKEAIRLDSTSVEAHYALGNVLAKQKKLDEAMAAFRAALDLNPSHVQARNNLGNCQLLAGKIAEAIATYQQILQMRPNDVAVRRNLELAQELLRRR